MIIKGTHTLPPLGGSERVKNMMTAHSREIPGVSLREFLKSPVASNTAFGISIPRPSPQGILRE